MADPSVDLLQEGTLEIDNPQSKEEDEAVEEQRRRQKELTDLLADGIAEFNYDESTINSSATSFEGNEQIGKDLVKNIINTEKMSDAIEQGYKDVDYQDQLKVLYEVRVREINNLRDEFAKYKADKSQEISILKNKVTLSEAEIRHLQVSLKNSESLLVEKTEIINNFNQNVSSKNQHIDSLTKIIEQLKLEICSYTSTINELQLKQADNNPFSAGAHKFKSEELQKAHQNQIVKLETLLQEQTKRTEILEKENSRLEDTMKKLLKDKNETNEENNLAIMGLSKKLQNSQQQCRDLFLLGEAIKKESDHFKERMQQLEINKLDLSGDGFKTKKMDKETMMVHMEKLKRMLLDKDIEMTTLKTKLKFYNSDIEELFEYRRILSKMYTCEFKPCNNDEHEESLIFMQRQLQSYQQAVEDRNNQIINLNMVNKELQGKIEEMIQQTRTDIQNLSQKYSLPQLETMSNELKNAEITINELQKQLLEKNGMEEGRNNHLEQALTAVKNDLKRTEQEKNRLHKLIEEFKKSELRLNEENDRCKSKLQRLYSKLGITEDMLESDVDVHELNSLKSKYGQVHDQLHQVVVQLENMSPKRCENVNIILKLKKQIQDYLKNAEFVKIEEKLRHWDTMLGNFIEGSKNFKLVEEPEFKDVIEDLTNAKTMVEGEKFALEYQLKSCISELENAKKEIDLLKENRNTLTKESEDNARTIRKLNNQVNEMSKYMKLVEANKAELEKQLENTQKQLNEAKDETLQLHKEVSEVKENVVRENLVKELKDVENVLEQGRTPNDSSDSFQKRLQAEILKAELVLRERLQEDSIKKMQIIEAKYKKVLIEKCDVYNKEKEKWKNQEATYRKQFAAVLEECGKKMEELEKVNVNLIQICKINQEKYNKAVVDDKIKTGKWENLLEYYSANSMNIEKQGQKKMKSVLKKISMTQNKINLIESMYEEKIRKFKAEVTNISKT